MADGFQPPYEAADDFMQIVDSLLRDGIGAVALIEAYFDESYGEGGVLCIAGYAFTKLRLKRFDKAWRAMLAKYDLPFFRMSACAHHKKPFDKLTKGQCVAVETEAISLIKKYAECGFALTVDQADFESIAKGGGLVADAYELLVWLAVLTVRNWMEDTGNAGTVAYFFEAGHQFQGKANAMMDKAFKSPRFRELCMYRSHTFIGKEDARPAQAADLLAWQWFTDKKRRLDPRFTEPRKDLASLVEARHNVMHADAAFLADMMAGLAQMFGAPISLEVDASAG